MRVYKQYRNITVIESDAVRPLKRVQDEVQDDQKGLTKNLVCLDKNEPFNVRRRMDRCRK